MQQTTPAQRPSILRRKYIVSKSFQLRFIGYMAAAALLFVVAVYGATWYFFHDVARQARLDGLPPNHLFFKMLDSYYAVLNRTYMIPSLVLVVGMTVYSAIWSNRIAGPLFRLARYLRESAEGKSTGTLKFRENDFFQDIPEAFNQFLDAVDDGKVQIVRQQKPEVVKKAS